mmetsp:Transcript_23640/g.58451  ORF Transcript_23640/g.58451 Transcript_23640/m.58451 type:complete len:218 (-) Transcript_23640:7-660(-)
MMLSTSVHDNPSHCLHVAEPPHMAWLRASPMPPPLLAALSAEHMASWCCRSCSPPSLCTVASSSLRVLFRGTPEDPPCPPPRRQATGVGRSGWWSGSCVRAVEGLTTDTGHARIIAEMKRGIRDDTIPNARGWPWSGCSQPSLWARGGSRLARAAVARDGAGRGSPRKSSMRLFPGGGSAHPVGGNGARGQEGASPRPSGPCCSPQRVPAAFPPARI